MITDQVAEKLAEKYQLRLYQKTYRAKRKSHLGTGSFGYVFKNSKKRVVKVIKNFGNKIEAFLLEDEIRGACGENRYKYAVPTYGLIKVQTTKLLQKALPQETWGLVRLFIPYQYDYKPYKSTASFDYRIFNCWDARISNIRFTVHKGQRKYFLVDTATPRTINWVHRMKDKMDCNCSSTDLEKWHKARQLFDVGCYESY